MQESPASSNRSEDEVNISAVEIQQQFYEAVGEDDWALFQKEERKYLLQNVALALCGSPTKEGDLNESASSANLKLQGYGVKEEEICMTVFKKICQQAQYSHNGENVFISILRVLLVTPKEVGFFKKTPRDHWDNLHLKKGKDVTICVFHVFCVRKCTAGKYGNRSCRIFIDHDGRVYQNWQSYLSENLLPKGIMVVPENGEYRGSIQITEITKDEDMDSFEMPKVKLTVLTSPAMGLGAKVLYATDITSTVANVGALGAIIGAAFAAPVVAPILVAGAIGTGVVTGIYAIVRSSMHLADRGQHEQPIGLGSSEARSSWINIIMSTVGISFSAATKLVAWAASSGTNIKILMNAVSFLKYSNLATGFIGVANSLGDMIHKFTKYGEKPSGLEIFQFTTSALFLGIGVMSNATAQEIVQDAQATTINEARDALSSNVKRKAFDKVTAENRRTLGTINGNAETIRALKVIQDKDDFFAKIGRMNKDMNKNKVRVSLTSEGKTLINNQHTVSVSELYGMGKGARNELFSKLGPADTSTKNAPTKLYVSSCSGTSNTFTAKSLQIVVNAEGIIKITQFLTKLCKIDREFVAEVLSQLTAEIHDAFLLVCVEVTSFLPGDSCDKARLVYFIFDFIKSKVRECDFENDHAIVLILKSWVKNGRVDKNIILMLIDNFTQSLSTKQAKIGAFHSDPQNYDYIYEFRKRYKKFMTLQAGEVISIQSHKIVLKAITIEKLDKWLKSYCQENCDLLLEFTFKIISLLTEEEVDSLNMINPDDDIILRVVYYLIHEVVIIFELLNDFKKNGITPSDIVDDIKNQLIYWRSLQKLREHKICESCNGIYYFDE